MTKKDSPCQCLGERIYQVLHRRYLVNHQVTLQNYLNTLEYKHIIPRVPTILEYMFDNSLVFWTWIILVSTHHTHCKANIWPSTYHRIRKATRCKGIGYLLHALFLFMCFRTLIQRKRNSMPKR